MTVLEALSWANDTLKKAGVGDSPMLDAEVLLAHVFRVPKSWLFTHFDQELRTHEEEAFQKAIARRRTQEPVAYITGSRDFFKRSFAVNHFVLIPRPATEVLIEAVLETVRAPATSPQLPDTLLADIGTGSGAIAVTLAAESGLPVIASDESKQALAVAKQNAEEHGVADQIDVRQGHLAEPLIALFEKIAVPGAPLPYKHLVICANLPYLTQLQWETAQVDVRNYEPKTALVGGGSDGLELYWQLFRQLSKHRSVFPHNLTIACEIDPSQTAHMLSLVTHDFPRAQPRILKDLEGHDRVLIAEI